MSASGERREHSSHARLVGIFLFTDIEGSTRLWEADAERMQGALAEHDAIIKAAVAANHGEVFKTIGDAFCCFFVDGGDAISAAVEIQLGLASRNWSPLPDLRTRVSIYSGAAATRENDFFGPALNRAARVLAAAHGGQILVSQSVMDGVVALPRGITLRDLGQHRLRDVQQPEYLYQVLHAELQPEFPPLRTLTTTPDHLPKPVSSFVGREREVGQIASMLRQTRLLTLTGAGGTGKTRLALEVARRRRADYGDGAWFVDLSPLLDGGLIAQAAATALGVAWEAGQDISDTLKSYLQSRVVLLVLDNCEHLVDAVARFVSETLSGSAGLTILATSRQALGLPGESTFRVPSMELPAKENRSLTKLRDSDPIRLFVDRAALAQAGFALTQENSETLSRICEELEGIPLAIELAAARVRSMPLEKIAERLDQRFRLLSQSVRGVIPRHQTLRAMIDWSYDLLSEPERLLLQRI
ncbi:adenylate/guanylate cyclase domain-containing protein [Fimbriimonas ginsengisoli]|nr:adenylate/guanylate cyclase domain-containing protein [Fimbriimonas ginsengisoli]